jgi:hypothetical protein
MLPPTTTPSPLSFYHHHPFATAIMVAAATRYRESGI